MTMTDNVLSNINSVEDVKEFFHYLTFECNVNFHPDEDFANYISFENKTPTFTDEVMLFNRLMDDSFDVFKKNETDIYKIGCNELF